MLTLASASGNVFAYLWAKDAPAGFEGPAWARALCPRGDGLGLDGLFLLQEPAADGTWDMDHWEPDGTHTFCSNGTRAAAALLPPDFTGRLLATSSGETVHLDITPEGVALRLPQGEGYGLFLADLNLPHPWAYGWTGTPHLILEVPDVDSIDLPTFAPPLRHHPDLPAGANVSLVSIEDPGLARIRSWERGVEGETLCCGQGCAVAGAWLAARTGHLSWTFRPKGRDAVRVLAGGATLGPWSDLWLSGPVRRLGRFTPGPGIDLP